MFPFSFKLKELESSMEDRYRRTKEAIRKAAKAEISVTRDLMIKAFPELLSECGAVVTPAPPPPPATAAATKEDVGTSKEDFYVPPEWAVQAEEETEGMLTPESLKSAIQEALPFKDDMDIWDVMRLAGAHVALTELLDGNLPDDVERVTANAKYVKHIVTSAFTDSYTEDHMIPLKADPVPGEAEGKSPALPPVSRRVLAVLNTLATRYAGKEFNVNTFWEQVRAFFPEVCSAEHTGKPSVPLVHPGQDPPPSFDPRQRNRSIRRELRHHGNTHQELLVFVRLASENLGSEIVEYHIRSDGS